jgi:hypothetical protein
MSIKPKSALMAAAAAAALAAATPAAATTFLFSVDLNQGYNQSDKGLLTGTFDLAGPLNTIWTGAATNLKITSAPLGIPLPEGNTVTSWTQQISNRFTLNYGEITFYDFMALTAPGTDPQLTLSKNQDLATSLCLNNVHAELQGGGRGCAQGSIFLGQKKVNYGFRTDRPLATFTQAPGGGGAVPEPASWALMISGFGMAGVALRRRRAQVAHSA